MFTTRVRTGPRRGAHAAQLADPGRGDEELFARGQWTRIRARHRGDDRLRRPVAPGARDADRGGPPHRGRAGLAAAPRVPDGAVGFLRRIPPRLPGDPDRATPARRGAVEPARATCRTCSTSTACRSCRRTISATRPSRRSCRRRNGMRRRPRRRSSAGAPSERDRASRRPHDGSGAAAASKPYVHCLRRCRRNNQGEPWKT